MRFVRWLLRTHPPHWRQTLLYTVAALASSLLINVVLFFSLPSFGVDTRQYFHPIDKVALLSFIGSITATPLVETLVLAGMLEALRRFVKNEVVVALIAAFLWGGIHQLSASSSFLFVAWGFFVFSCAYLGGRRQSFSEGFTAAALPHALGNALLLTLVAVRQQA